jgi:hypothetical protein
MTELRWILLGAGIAMLVGLYLWGVRVRRRSGIREAERSMRIEPAPVVPVISVPAPPAPSAPVAPADSVRVEPEVRLEHEAM